MANKYKEYSAGRDDGLSLALRIVRDGGLCALEKECKDRGVSGINTSYSSKELEDAIEKIKNRVLDSILAMSVYVLHDEFGFGKKRLCQFSDRFNRESECMEEGLLDFQDVVNAVSEKTGVFMEIRLGNGEVVKAQKSA